MKKATKTLDGKQVAPVGLRERNKQAKEKAIRQAARSLFAERGFEETTLRAVAERADVGFGTVFSYAVDKAGLLAMVYVEELASLPALFDEDTRRADPFDELVAACAKLFIFWARTPRLTHRVLQQMEFYGDTPHMRIILERRDQVRNEIASWVIEQQQVGRLEAAIDPQIGARTIFAIYTSVIREWSVATPEDPLVGIENLRQLLALPLKAMLPS